jgi:hypothetical protein
MNSLIDLINGNITDIDSIRKMCIFFQDNLSLKNGEIDKLQDIFNQRIYCHPNSTEIKNLIKSIPTNNKTNYEKAKWIFDWCVNNLEYGRLKKPFFPLIRTDLDVLELKEGTCGDFSNLFVSCMESLDIPSKYVIVDRDSYNDRQSHICSAFYNSIENRWILVDPTPAYGCVSGWDVRHKEIKFIEKEEYWVARKQEEYDWIKRSILEYKSLFLSGILFAPFIYEGFIKKTDRQNTTLFAYLTVDNLLQWHLMATLHDYTKKSRSCPIRITSVKLDNYEWAASINEDFEVWDEKRWKPKRSVDENAIEENDQLKIAMKHLYQVKPKIDLLIELIEKEKLSKTGQMNHENNRFGQ